MTARTFTYHRAIAPMMWVLVGLSLIELLIVHALLAIWYPRVAIGLSLVSLAGVAWLIATIRSFRQLPIRIDDAGIEMRVGRLKSIRVPAERPPKLRSDWSAATLKRREVLNLALIAYPNVMIVLAEPQRVGRRRIEAVAHRLDDPAGFTAAIEALGRRDD